MLVIPPPPLIKVASNTRPYSKLGGTTLNGREEGGQYYILQTCDQERFEARKVVFPWECLIIFAAVCSFSLPEWQAVKMTFFATWHHSRKLKGAVFISFMTFHKKTDIFYFSFSLHQTPFCLSVSLITCSKLQIGKVKICYGLIEKVKNIRETKVDLAWLVWFPISVNVTLCRKFALSFHKLCQRTCACE